MTSKPDNITPLRQTYQIKITLENIKPPIWRRLKVDSRIPLDDLHDAIQTSMGWLDCHLHHFIDKEQRFYQPKDIDGEFAVDFGPAVVDESAILLNEILKKEHDWLKYEYDFGDGWSHKIILEKILPYEHNQFPVICIKGKRACPPEDCGGPWGYASLLETLKSPETDEQEREELMEWLDGDFDPEAFDIEEINLELEEDFQDVLFNLKPGLDNELNNRDIPASEDLSSELDMIMNDEEIPDEIKDLVGGMNNAMQIVADMSEMIDLCYESFKEVAAISKDKKVRAIANKMIKILDDDDIDF